MAIRENGRQFQFGISANVSRIKTGYYHLSKTQRVILKAKERTLTSFDRKVRRPQFGILGTQHMKETSRIFIRGQSRSTQHGKQPLEPSDAGPTLCLWWLFLIEVSRWIAQGSVSMNLISNLKAELKGLFCNLRKRLPRMQPSYDSPFVPFTIQTLLPIYVS